MKPNLLIAALFVAATASAQSPLTLPNNSAGTPLDTPPQPPAASVAPRSTPATQAFDVIDAGQRGYVTREDLQQLLDPAGFDAADENHDGRLDKDEFQRFFDAPAK